MEGTGRGRGRGRPVPVQPTIPLGHGSSLVANRPSSGGQVSPDQSSPEISAGKFGETQVTGWGGDPGNGQPIRARGRGYFRGGARGGAGRGTIEVDVIHHPDPPFNELAARYEEVPEQRKQDEPVEAVPEAIVREEEVDEVPAQAVVAGNNVPNVAEPVPGNSHPTDSVDGGPRPAEEDVKITRMGTKGDPIPLVTNYLTLKYIHGHPGIVEYHVSITPAVEAVKHRRMIIDSQECVAVLGNIRNFDGMVLFLPKILKDDVTVIKNARARSKDGQELTEPVTVTVTFKKVKKLTESTIFLNILLRRIMVKMQFKELRRQFYDLNMAVAYTAHKLEVWPGYAVSAENLEGGLLVCVDACNRILNQDSIYDHFKLLNNDPRFKTKFEEYVYGKICITKYNFKCYRIDGVDWASTPQSTFRLKDKDIPIKDYLDMKYKGKADVKHLAQPLLMSTVKARKDEAAKGISDRLVLLVPELCHMTGLTDEQRANFKVMSDLASSTRLVPTQRTQNLQNFLNRILGDSEVMEIINVWGLTFDKYLVGFQGRKVDGPDLQFGKRLPVVKKAAADFSREAGRGVYDPVDVKSYAILCTERDAPVAHKFIKTYNEVAGPLGIKILQNAVVQTLKGMRPNDFKEALMKLGVEKFHFVVVLMPTLRDDVYAAIKRYCVHDVPVPSQCVVTKTLQNDKRFRSIMQKICQQVNCKLGGGLWALKLPVKEEIMFVGIDAAHDPLKKDASVICLVASLNRECTKYYSNSKTSGIHQEQSVALRGMMKEALEEYRQVVGRFPDRIIVYRDGGSLGAMDTITNTEIKDIKAGVVDAEATDAKFTFVLVCKRIAQRFMLKKNATNYDNPPPGVIVDNTVTRLPIYDFYVVSQLVRQGTVNPTHFIVMDRDDPITPDMIQRLSYMTCFMYYNWSGTVRVPAMVQYAHKMSALLIRHVKAAPHASIRKTLYYL